MANCDLSIRMLFRSAEEMLGRHRDDLSDLLDNPAFTRFWPIENSGEEDWAFDCELLPQLLEYRDQCKNALKAVREDIEVYGRL